MFYRYDKGTGLWLQESHAVLQQLACDTVNHEADGKSDFIEHAQFSFARAGSVTLKG